jgi:hypothetical protein
MVGPVIVNEGKVVRPSQLIASVRRTILGGVEVTKSLALLLTAAGLCGAVGVEPLVQVSVAELRLCLPRQSVAFVMRNVSSSTVEVGCSVERQDNSGEWVYYQESIGTPWVSKAARVWSLSPGHEERAIWLASNAQSGRFAPGRYRLVVSTRVIGKGTAPASQLQEFIGPEFALETCKP